MMKIKKNDEVIVIAGKDKGSIGSVKNSPWSKSYCRRFKSS